MRSSFASLLSLVIPTVMAVCPTTYIPIPDPGKCWDCATNGDFGSTSGKNNVADSWTDFYCKYSKRDSTTLSDPDRKDDKPFIEVMCTYNGNGELIKRAPSGQSCPSKASPKPAPCEAPKRPPMHGPTPFEDCCGKDCKKETEKCFYCPKRVGNWVDVDASGKDLICEYHSETEMHDQSYTCMFDGTTGKTMNVRGRTDTLCVPGSVAPQRAECLKKNPQFAVKKESSEGKCPTDASKSECDQLLFTGCKDACPSGQGYCANLCSTDDCWTCPMISGTARAYANIITTERIDCSYYKKDQAGNLESAGLGCVYLTDSGNLRSDWSTSGCPSKAAKDVYCARKRS